MAKGNISPMSVDEAYEHYKGAYLRCVYSLQDLQQKYQDYEDHRTDWEEHGKKSEYGKRDYVSYLNSQEALNRVISDIKKDAINAA